MFDRARVTQVKWAQGSTYFIMGIKIVLYYCEKYLYCLYRNLLKITNTECSVTLDDH
jgi:hypothetical protein